MPHEVGFRFHSKWGQPRCDNGVWSSVSVCVCVHDFCWWKVMLEQVTGSMPFFHGRFCGLLGMELCFHYIIIYQDFTKCWCFIWFHGIVQKKTYAMYAYKSSPSGQGPASWNSCSRLCGSAQRALEHSVFLVRALFSWILRRICDRRALRMGILSWTTWW